MWFTYNLTASAYPTWTKVQTSNSIASQATVNTGTNNTDLVTPLTLQKRNFSDLCSLSWPNIIPELMKYPCLSRKSLHTSKL